MPSPPRKQLYKAKCHFLTFPAAPADLEREQLFAKLTSAASSSHATIDECYIARELHEDGSPHFHVYLKTNKRINVYADTWEFKHGDNITQRGNWQSVRDIKKVCEYLMKEDEAIFCYGPFHIRDIVKARKSHKSKACAMVLQAGKITMDMLHEHPEMLMQLDKIKRGLEIVNDIQQRDAVTVPAPSCWYPWQESLLNLLNSKPNPRKIHWFVDYNGNKGKSYLARYLVDQGKAVIFAGGASKDILYGYRGQGIVIFDFSREKEETMNYSVIETLKNGVYYSSKYESEMRVYKVPHIVCFSNFDPDLTKLSEDRWDITHLD